MIPSGAFQISTGLGAGNIGDEIMARGFWDSLPPTISLEVALFPWHGRHRAPYPGQHRYRDVDWAGNENGHVTGGMGLMVGDTPVNEAEGLHFPLGFLRPRLRHFHERGIPVHAIGVGVDRLGQPEGLELFRDAFLPIRTWTVRSEFCREALLAMGVSGDRIAVGADWAWSYRPRGDRREWAADVLRRLGVDPAAPLVIANLVNMIWQDAHAARRAVAAALDRIAAMGFEICFFNNECRDGEFFDFAAASQIRDLMRRRAVLIPNLYYSADEAIGLLSHATVAVGQRYHFVLEAILAGSVPVCLLRGQKMRALAAELGLPAPGSIESVEEDALVAAILGAARTRDAEIRRLSAASDVMRQRAGKNLYFVLPPS
jgi:polysaccharide pyruvyl transferase WcaK-like protein